MARSTTAPGEFDLKILSILVILYVYKAQFPQSSVNKN